jgi:hypothetical protein
MPFVNQFSVGSPEGQEQRTSGAKARHILNRLRPRVGETVQSFPGNVFRTDQSALSITAAAGY